MILTQVQEGKFKYMNTMKPTGRNMYKRTAEKNSDLILKKHVGEGLIIIRDLNLYSDGNNRKETL